MIVLRDGEPAPAALRGGALALGNFDGVHRGHQAVIGAAMARARADGRPALAATFDPHPSRLFRPDAPPFALTTLDQKLALFAGLGLDGAVVIPFDRALASLSAGEFAEAWLRDRIAPAHVVTGYDFTFGANRSGDAEALAWLGERHGFTTEAVPAVTDAASEGVAVGGPGAGGPVSSTRIRAALAAGDMAAAAALLTRPFTIRAEVIHGDKRGRTIGVPTANMALGDYCRPRYGVYAVRARLPDGASVAGVGNLGVRPMFDPPKELLETWLLDWNGDLYGQTLDIELVAHLRDEMRLDGLDALKAQIAHDEAAARAVLE